MKNLSSSQRDAIDLLNGHVLISAGPGSGKTYVIIERIKKIINNGYAKPEQILAITFTKKATREMSNRLMESRYKGVDFKTIHGFALKELRKNIIYNNMIIDEDDSNNIIKKIIDNKYKTFSEFEKKDILESFIKTKNNELDMEDISYDNTYGEIYIEYVNVLRNRNLTDFDIIIDDYKTLSNDESYLKKLKDRYKYIFIDEYQDTSSSQYKIIKNISFAIDNICLVGDLDQSIYLWRGASGDIIKDTLNDFNNLIIVNLVDNFRSGKKIVSFNNKIISKNINPVREPMQPAKNHQGSIRIVKFNNKYQEIDWIINEIKNNKLFNSAILLRVNYQFADFELALKKASIKYDLTGGVSFYKRKIIKIILSYLKIAINPLDLNSFIYSITYPKRGVGNKTLEKVDIIFNNFNYDNYINKLVSVKKNKNLDKYIEDISVIKELLSNNKIIDSIEYIKNIVNINNTINDEEKDLIDKLIEILSNNNYNDNYEILDRIYMDNDIEEVDGGNYVTLSTIHSAKGKEFSNVFVPFLVEGNIPWYKSYDKIEQLNEELRIFYVATTRSINKLYLTYHAQERGIRRIRSRFLEDNTSVEEENKIDNIYIGDKVIVNGDKEGIILRIYKELNETYYEIKISDSIKTYSKKITKFEKIMDL